MTTPSLQRVHSASAVTAEEIEVVDAERTAYRRFVRRLDGLEPVEPTAGTLGLTPDACLQQRATRTTSDTDSLQQARQAYRETVMRTPHYDAEYGESLRENVAAEFGTTLAAQFADGVALTPALQRSVREAATTAVAERADFLRSLRAEQRSLTDCTETLETVQAGLNEVHGSLRRSSEPAADGVADRLAEIERECEQLATRRQERIHSRPGTMLSGVDETSLAGYLYDDLDTVCPALAAVAECLDTVRSCRRRLR